MSPTYQNFLQQILSRPAEAIFGGVTLKGQDLVFDPLSIVTSREPFVTLLTKDLRV